MPRGGEGSGYRSPDRRVMRDYGFGPEGRYNVSGSYEEDFQNRRYSQGLTGQMYGQNTGYGVNVERYTGGWESTVGTGSAARGPHIGKGPRGYKRSDDRIREDVNERLTRDGDAAVHIGQRQVEIRISLSGRA